ncbi:MAG TPA: TPM domain-containing protein [Terrimicrobiaceae bacterium]
MKERLFWGLWLVVATGGAILATAWGVDPRPTKPSQYVVDRAHVLSPQTSARLNSRLEAFERDTSNQVIVATFPKIPDGYALEDFTQRAAEAWGIGQSKNDNGVVLFVFPSERKTRIEVGYGLEGVLPDILAKRIIENEMLPAFRAGNFDLGIERAVNAILQATRGEYQGSGQTTADSAEDTGGSWFMFVFFLLILMVVLSANRGARRRGTYYGPGGTRTVWTPPIVGGWSGGGRSSGSGGSFGGGGGSFGGGGASGSW